LATPSWISPVIDWFRREEPVTAAARPPASRRSPETSPSGQTFSELPPVSFSDWDNLSAVKGALSALEVGDFGQAASLVDAMMRDDRIAGVVDARLDALHSLEMEFCPPEGEEDNQRAKDMAAECLRGWSRWIPEADQRELRFWGLWLGVSFGPVTWERGDRWTPRMQVWHPRNLRWSQVDDRFVATAMEGQVTIEPGAGAWVLFTPFGARRGWMRGLVRSLAVPWLIRQWGLRDWAGHSEAHGSPAKKAKVPPGAEDKDKKKFLREVASLAKRSAVLLEQGKKTPNGETPGYDVELLEATADGHKVFAELLGYMDSCIAVRVKGANLSTEVKGGSFAAARVHREVDDDKLRFDAETVATCLHDQVFEPWAEFNHAARELAPWPEWDTEAPEDLKARAETLDKLGDALKKLGDAAVPADAQKLAEDFGIPLREITEDERKRIGLPPIYEYHITSGIVTPNQVLERLGLPPREGGDVPVQPPAAAAPPPKAPEPPPPAKKKAAAAARLLAAAAEGFPPGAIEGQRYVDDIVGHAIEDATAALSKDLAALLRIVRETPARDGKPDGDAIRRALVAHYRGMDPERLATLTTKASVLAELNGRAAVLEDL
jgi:phage gp29-like protein